MDIVSRPHRASQQPDHRVANIVGTLIAVLTLTLPAFVILYYSQVNAKAPTDYNYALTRFP
jgi:hypothetical protein